MFRASVFVFERVVFDVPGTAHPFQFPASEKFMNNNFFFTILWQFSLCVVLMHRPLKRMKMIIGFCMEKQATERFFFCSVNIKIYKFSELACGSHLHGEILVQFFFQVY